SSQTVAVVFFVLVPGCFVGVVKFSAGNIKFRAREVDRAGPVFQLFIVAHIHAKVTGAQGLEVFFGQFGFGRFPGRIRYVVWLIVKTSFQAFASAHDILGGSVFLITRKFLTAAVFLFALGFFRLFHT